MWWSRPPTSSKLTVGTTASGSTSASVAEPRPGAGPPAGWPRQLHTNCKRRGQNLGDHRLLAQTRGVLGKPSAAAFRGASAGLPGRFGGAPAAQPCGGGRRVLDRRAASSSEELVGDTPPNRQRAPPVSMVGSRPSSAQARFAVLAAVPAVATAVGGRRARRRPGLWREPARGPARRRAKVAARAAAPKAAEPHGRRQLHPPPAPVHRAATTR